MTDSIKLNSNGLINSNFHLTDQVEFEWTDILLQVKGQMDLYEGSTILTNIQMDLSITELSRIKVELTCRSSSFLDLNANRPANHRAFQS